jgi:multidrug efflux pump subunit AcrB
MDWITGITRLALARPAVVLLVTLFVVVGGIFAASHLKKELLPDYHLPAVTVATGYPGAGANAVVEDVTIPIENAVSNLGGLKRLHSISSDNLSVVITEFNYGTDMERVRQEAEAEVKSIVLPEGADQPCVELISFSDLPVIWFSLLGKPDVSELETIARRDVLPAVEQVEGVAQVTIDGTAAQQVLVNLSPQALAQYGLTTQQVAVALRENNFSRPAGIILDSQGQVQPVRTTSRYRSLEDIRNLPVANSEAASPVLLSDIGQVEMTTDPFRSIYRTNGRLSLSVAVSKESDANTVEVANRIRDKIDDIRESLPADVEIVVVFDQSDFIEDSVTAMIREGALGFLFAVIVIYLFLTGVRPTLVTAISIPLSIIVALIFLVWQGITLNIITMAGLTVAIGRVVDDSIVVLENIYRHARQGERLSQAAYTATREVGTAIFVSTLATAAVFLPLALAGGLVGEIFFSFALTVTIALLASLLVALTIVPVLARYLLPAAPAEGPRPGWLRRLFPLGPRQLRLSLGDGPEEETWLLRIYTPVLRWALRHRVIALTAGLALSIGSFALLPFIPTAFLPGGGPNVIHAYVHFPPSTSLATTEAVGQEIEELLGQAEGLKIHETQIGQPDLSQFVVMASVEPVFGLIPSSGTIALYLHYLDGANMGEAIDWVRQTLNDLPEEPSPQPPEEPTPPEELSPVEEPTPAEEPTPPDVHSVQSGDTLSAIASMHQTTVEELVRLNDLPEPSLIYQGQTIILPHPSQMPPNAIEPEEGEAEAAEAEADKTQAGEAEAAEAKADGAQIAAASTVHPTGEKRVSVAEVGIGAQTDQVEITVAADSLQDVKAASDQLIDKLKKVEHLENVASDLVSARPETEVEIDPQKASAYGLSAEDVSQLVTDALFGQKATETQLDGRTTDVYVRVAYGDDSDEGVMALPLAPGGTPVLADVAEVTQGEAPVQVSRVDRRQAATITGIITSDDLRGVSSDVDAAIAAVDKAPGVEIKKGGILEEQQEAFNSLYLILAIAVAVVYIVMVASLGSLTNPIIILVSLPFAAIGSFIALFITGREIGLPAMIGFLMLIGIVVTNAIVFITFVEQQRARGLPSREALIQSGRTRARPILMTALTTIFALIPLSLGLNEGVLIAAELGTVVIGGLLSATILTLLVIPVVYSLVDDLRSRLGRQPRMS